MDFPPSKGQKHPRPAIKMNTCGRMASIVFKELHSVMKLTKYCLKEGKRSRGNGI
jgi:hypothetical protein